MAKGSKPIILKKLFLILTFITIFNGGTYSNGVYHKWKNHRFIKDTVFTKIPDPEFENTIFSINAVFVNDTFFNNAFFWNAFFSKKVNFTLAVFSKDGIFYYAKFLKDADFQEATFSKDAIFLHSHFLEGADFSNLTSKKTYFDFCSFKRKLNLSKINGDSLLLSFDHTQLPDSIDLSHIPEIPHKIDLTLADLEKITPDNRCWLEKYFMPAIPYNADNDTTKHYIKINLYNTNISKIRIDYIHFRLWLTDTYAKEDTNWYKKYRDSLNDDQKSSIYESLLENFKDNGQTDSYKTLDIDYKYFQTNGSFWSFWLEDWWWQFGYQKWRIFLHTTVFLLIFTLFTFFFLHKLVAVYKIDNVEVYPFENPFKRLWFSIIYTSTLFFPLSLKMEKVITFKSFWMIYITIIFLTGILCVGYMANFVLAK